MTEAVAHLARPQRWDAPFGPDMTDADVQRLLARPEFAGIDATRFPRNTPLAGILKNDARLVRCQPGDIVVREGDYGNSAFLILTGKLRVVLAPGLPPASLGRLPVKKKSFFASLAQLWRNRRIPEVRDGMKEIQTVSQRVFLQDIPAVLDQNKTALLEAGALFGELAALGRVPRTATVFAESDAELLEIRWQGLRDLRKSDEGWKKRIDERYRANALKVHLRATPLFAGLSEDVLQKVVEATLFETFGTFDWHVSYKRLGSASEAPIARQGDYTDGLILVRAGFARVTSKLGAGERTLTYLTAGDAFGFEELYDSWKTKTPVELQTSLTAVGYVDVLRVPARILEEFVFPTCRPPERRLTDHAARPLADDAMVEWLVDERFINGTKAMLLDLDKCVRCDDCVRACASTHDGNPRFLRSGKTFDHWMVTHACMHCADPVCMIGCPTGAIHRSQQTGNVVINDATCVGCGTCANSCPYENISMVGINDGRGRPVVDPKDNRQIQKATKCDFCESQLGGPACVRACPHDALARVDFRQQVLR